MNVTIRFTGIVEGPREALVDEPGHVELTTRSTAIVEDPGVALVDEVGNFQSTVLHSAAYSGSRDVVEAVIAAIEDVLTPHEVPRVTLLVVTDFSSSTFSVASRVIARSSDILRIDGVVSEPMDKRCLRMALQGSRRWLSAPRSLYVCTIRACNLPFEKPAAVHWLHAWCVIRSRP